MILSGILLTPTGVPYSNSLVRITANNTSPDVLMFVTKDFKTDTDGEYEIDVPNGWYKVSVFVNDYHAFTSIGNIEITDATTETTINALLMIGQTAHSDPLVAQVAANAASALASKNAAAVSATASANSATTSQTSAANSQASATASASSASASASSASSANTSATNAAQSALALGLVPESFGAIGNNIADDSTAWSSFLDALISSGSSGRGTPNARYKINTSLSKTLVEGNILNLDMNGSTFIQGGNNTVLSLLNSNVGTIPSAVVEQVSYNLGNGGTLTNVMKVTATAHPFTVIGQVGKVFSDDLVPDSDGSNQFCGECFTVGAIESADVFYTTGVFDEAYVTNIKVARPSNAKVKIKNLQGESVWADTTTASFCNIQGFQTPVIDGITTAKDINAPFLNITGNYRVKVGKVVGRNIKNRPDLLAYGYLVNDSAGYYSEVNGIDCINARHAYTTSTPTSTVANDDKWWLRGRTIGSIVRNGFGQGCHNAFDTHSPALRVKFINCETADDFRGNDTGGAGIQIRGNDCEIIDCDVSKSKIGVAQSGASKTSNARLTIRGLKYNGPSGHTPVVINGSDTYTTLVNFQGDINSQAPIIFDITNAKVVVRNTNVIMSPVSNGSSLVTLNTGASLEWEGGSLNILAGNTHKIIDHEATGTKSYVQGLRVDGVSGRLSYLGTSASQYVIESTFRKLRLDAALAGGTFLGQETTSPKVSAEYIVGYNTKPLGYRVFTFASAGNQTIDIQLAGDDRVFVRVEAQIAGVVINTLTQGAFPGQILIINNRNSSTASLVIANSSGGLLTLGSSATLTAGRGITLVWDGSTWRSANQHV